jgi:hypothetical protein
MSVDKECLESGSAVKDIKENSISPGTVALRSAAAAMALGFAAPMAHAALQVQLHQVNTSVGLQPTTATNKWKLQTDPSVTITNPTSNESDQEDPPSPFHFYIPIAGQFGNTWDPTKFNLAVSPVTNTYSLGDTVDGLLPYQVLSFDVLMKDGGSYHVQEDPTNPALDDVIPNGDVGGGEAGEIDNVNFALIGDLKSTAPSADSDPFLYEINLIPIDPGPDFDPGVATVKIGPNDFYTIGPSASDPNSEDPVITTFNNPDEGQIINGATTGVPEPATSGLLAALTFGLFGRRPKKQA